MYEMCKVGGGGRDLGWRSILEQLVWGKQRESDRFTVKISQIDDRNPSDKINISTWAAPLSLALLQSIELSGLSAKKYTGFRGLGVHGVPPKFHASKSFL